MYVVMKNAGLSGTEINTRAQMEKDIADIRSKLSRNDSEFTNEKNRLQTEIAKLKDLNTKLESDKTEINSKLKTLEKDNNSISGQIKTLQEEKKNLESQVSKLNNELSEYHPYYFCINTYTELHLLNCTCSQKMQRP